jgi:hypothetical protein
LISAFAFGEWRLACYGFVKKVSAFRVGVLPWHLRIKRGQVAFHALQPETHSDEKKRQHGPSYGHEYADDPDEQHDECTAGE